MKKSKAVMISLSDNYIFELDKISKELQLTKSDIIRRALDLYFKERG